MVRLHVICLFFFNDTATTEIYTLSLPDALPISAAGSEALDGGHFSPVRIGGQIEPPADRDTIHERRAAAAESLAATFACPEKTEVAPQNLEQRLVCCDFTNRRAAIQLESDRPAMGFRHQSLPKGRVCAWRRARKTRSGVSGISVTRTSTASYRAFPIAGETQNIPVSPTPLAPNGP